MSAPEPAFSHPWHAQVFAMTVSLNEAGHFSWAEWAHTFGATLTQHGLSRELDGGDDYFNAWLDTLETFLAQKQMAEPCELSHLKEAWTQAYLDTPHGDPVRLRG